MKAGLVDRLVLKELAPIFCGCVVMCLGLFLVGPLMDALRFGHQVKLSVIFELVWLSVPLALGLAVPVAMLLAARNGFGELAKNQETIALSSSGVSVSRMLCPAALFAVAVAVATFLVNNSLAPQAGQRLDALKSEALKHVAPSSRPIDLPDYRPNGRLAATFHAEHGIDVRSNALRDLTVDTFGPDGKPTAVAHASRAVWLGDPDYRLWRFTDLDIDRLGAAASLHFPSVTSPELASLPAPRVSPRLAVLLQRDPQTLSLAQLRTVIRALGHGPQAQPDKVREAELQMWSLFAMPVAAVVFAVIGAPLGLRSPRVDKSNGWSQAAAVVLCYYMLSMTVRSLALAGNLSPACAAFFPDLVGLLAGAALCRKASFTGQL